MASESTTNDEFASERTFPWEIDNWDELQRWVQLGSLITTTSQWVAAVTATAATIESP